MINVTLYSGNSEKLFDVCNKLLIRPIELTQYVTSARINYIPLCDEELKEKLDDLFESFKGTEFKVATNSKYVILYLRLLHKQGKINLHFTWFAKDFNWVVPIDKNGNLHPEADVADDELGKLYLELL